MAKFLAKFMAYLARDPEKNVGAVLKLVLSVVIVILLLLSIASLEMIGVFADGGNLINEKFKVNEEKIYEQISKTYLKYQTFTQAAMDKREQEIIEENTELVEVEITDENGNVTTTEVEVCDVTVSKEIVPINFAYIFAYINHYQPIKDGEKYKHNEDEILNFLETISPIREEVNGTHYSLYTVLMKPEDVAKEFFKKDDDRQMYELSYELYLSFLDYVDEGRTEIDVGDDIPRGHYTFITDEEEEELLENLSDDIGRNIVEFALSKLGAPYSQEKRHDGVHFDCSSLCYYAYKYAGLNITYDGMTTAAALCNYCDVNNQTISYSELQPGDLIFYSFKENGRYKNVTHVGIYAGSGKIIDASYSKGYVVYRDLYSKGSIVSCGRPR